MTAEGSRASSWLERIRGAPSNPIAEHYSRFRVAERLLLTGHSHQAWPDRAVEGQVRAFEDAAELVDDKWDRAFAVADRVRRGWARWLDDPGGEIALGPSTHDLLIRLISDLDLEARPRLVTTTGEFHSLRRQLARLEEAGLEVERIGVEPLDTLSERLAAAVSDRTAAVFVSKVLFRDARIVPGLGRLAGAARRHGTELVVDAYHAMNVVPFSVREEGLEDAWVTGGGYKYCQLGEGNAFLRVPPGREPRPVVTGWFAEFADLTAAVSGDRVAYGPGASAFATATYEPVSHYRAAEVFDHFDGLELDPAELRRISRHQIALLDRALEDLDADPRTIRRAVPDPLEGIGGFLALRAPEAGPLARELARRGVRVDFRDDVLRLGPAPYLRDSQLLDAVVELGEVLRGSGRGSGA